MSITYPKMVDLVHVGTRVLIDDGLIALDVKQIVNGTDIVCTVINGGVLGGRKGISVPGCGFADAFHRRKGSQRHHLRH